MARKRTGGARGRRAYATGERFAAVPVEVMESAAFHAVTPMSRCVLQALAAQYTGGNNGRLTLPLTAAARLGIRSKDSLVKGLHELARVGLVEVTHQGGLPPHGCSRYALTWRGIDPAEGAGLVAAPPSHRWTKYTGPAIRREPPKRAECVAAAHGEIGTTSGPSIGPHRSDHRTTEAPQWSDHRTTEAVSLVRPSDPSEISGGGTPSDKVRRLLYTLPDLSDHEVARIAHTDASLVAELRLAASV